MTATIKKYLNAFEKSQQILNQLRILTFPIDIFSVLKDAGIFVNTVSEFKTHFPSNKSQIRDAKCYYYVEANKYLILYNENVNEYRIRFSLAHEFGHIVLGHLNEEITELSRGGLDDFTYFRMEGEANVFAGNFLAPPILINEVLKNYNFFNKQRLMELFALSETALEEYRKKDFMLWRNFSVTNDEHKILNRCGKTIYFCQTCHYKITVFRKEPVFCPICGNWDLSKCISMEVTSTVYYSKIIVDTNNGKAIVCPVCNNEDYQPEGDFCHICGEYIKNICTNCGSILTGNARYCSECAAISTFCQNGILSKWNEENINVPNSNETSSNSTDNIEFDENDLPF